jgi:hypothetical protein
MHQILQMDEDATNRTSSLSYNAFANVFVEGAYHRIDPELDKTHDEYLKHKKYFKLYI